ncbi:MAG: recombinase family protein [Burkholderiales bacterium]|nr:recombinase family protein [Burkholderiales bacterium]
MTKKQEAPAQTVRLWGYGRVSTSDQTAENQRHELKTAGYDIKPSRWVVDEGVSGSVPAMQRPAFAKLVNRISEALDEDHKEVLVVSKLDRLGRDAIDVMTTLDALKKVGVSVRVHALDGTDLNSSAGRFMLQMLAAVAELERNIIRERTAVAQARYVAEGGKLGRKPKTTEKDRVVIRERLAADDTVTQVAKDYKVSRATIISIRDSV